MGCNHLKSFLFLCIGMMLVLPYSHAHETLNAQQIEVALRMIGHEVLLSAGDSTSRVLAYRESKRPLQNSAGYRVYVQCG